MDGGDELFRPREFFMGFLFGGGERGVLGGLVKGFCVFVGVCYCGVLLGLGGVPVRGELIGL
jgi:hypothetical protein